MLRPIVLGGLFSTLIALYFVKNKKAKNKLKNYCPFFCKKSKK